MTRYIPYLTTSAFSSAVTDLVLIYESVPSTATALNYDCLTNESFRVRVTLRLTVSQSVCLGVEPRK
jgi:hypothetical protein